MMKLENRYINEEMFLDEFGNVKQQFEVIIYMRLANDEWVENKKIVSGRSYYNVDGQLYLKSDDCLIKLNMSFDSPTCGACYAIGNQVDNIRKITGNEVLFETKSVRGWYKTLHKQNYSDGTSFYTLKDKRGRWEQGHASQSLKDIIENVEHELAVSSKSETTNEILSDYHSWLSELIGELKTFEEQSIAV